MIQVYNPTPLDMKWMHLGKEYLIKAGKRLAIQSYRATHGETVADFDVVSCLMGHLGPKGLQVVTTEDGDNKPEEEMQETGLAAWKEWAQQQIEEFNNLNLALAAENRPTLRPHKDLLAVVAALKALDAGETEDGPELVGKGELDAVRAKAEANALAFQTKLRAAMQTGDQEAINSILAELGNVMPAGKQPVLIGAPSNSEIVEPPKPVGKGAGRIPTRARVAGQPGMRRGGPSTE